MKYQLINNPNPQLTTKEQILFNRGIPIAQIQHYLHLTDEDIFPPEMLGEEVLKGAADVLLKIIKNNGDIYVVVDCDCDGYTSGAITINYIYDLTSKEYIENHVKWFMHEGKQHGLSDCIDTILEAKPNLVIIPDAGSNDVEYIKKLRDASCEVIILDHHDLEVEPYEDCYLINSQLRNYPNKFLSGAGVVYQFCRYIDKITDNNYADWYLDLCATGLNYLS